MVDEVVELLELNFGKMKVTTGDGHMCLGMKITYYFDKGTVGIDVRPYLQQTIDDFGEDDVTASTPARADLFCVNKTKPLVDERRRKLFDRIVYRLMHCTCRGRKDLQIAISFLSKRDT